MIADPIDPVVAHLLDRGLQVTRRNYLDFAFPDGVPRPLDAEVDAGVRSALDKYRRAQRDAQIAIRRARRR